MTRFPPPPPGAERRAHPRYPVVVAVQVAHDDAVALASLVDLSHGGAFLELADPSAVELGVRVRVHIAVDGLDVNEEAKVVRVTRGSPAGCAVAWTAPGPAVAAVVQPVSTAPGPMPIMPRKNGSVSMMAAGGKIQKPQLFRRGKAISGAPIIMGSM